MMTKSEATSPATTIVFEPWSCCALPSSAIPDPAQLQSTSLDWLPATVPGTAASALRASGRWDFQKPIDIDNLDWWYRTTFASPDRSAARRCNLCFDGLATLAEVWLNGVRLLTTDNMFRAYRLDIAPHLQASNELLLCFRSLTEDLKRKRPRPRWKTSLVNHQQLRWHRTSLLGRIPGWSPPVPAVGPWREIRIDTQPISLSDVRLVSMLDGTDGIVTFQARVQALEALKGDQLRVGSHKAPVEISRDAGETVLRSELRIPNPALWWPHTHGEQPLSDCELIMECAGSQHSHSLGKVGFRKLQVDTNGGFAISVNDSPIYCRGSCWTVSDIFTLSGSEESLKHDLQLARDAGMNMLRIGGTMTYESDMFYRLCDELGILVWQDFMFANMDYPVDNESFAGNVDAEARQQLHRLSSHPCVAVYCGNSEVEQQAAMLGMPRELWRNEWFAQRLPALCAELHPGTAYIPSTPSGGVLPFHTSTGITHYYGIGAYLRSPLELRKANVKFTSECLGFANIPEPETVDDLMQGARPVMHHPQWKQRVPRDTGAGWDFEDVRDFYLKHLYDVDPVELRSFDTPRYLQLSRVASGEMMAQTYAEWRSSHSHNRGGLVWFLKDLWPGAGWGIVDSSGLPKAAYYYLRRLWRSRQITLTDEGLDGLHLHVINEQPKSLRGVVEVTLLKEPDVVIARHEVPVDLAARSQQMLSVDEVLGGFYDVNYAYRFGPPHHDVVMATLCDAERHAISEAFYFTRRRQPANLRGVTLNAEARSISATKCQVTLSSDCFLYGVRLGAKGYLPDDNYFHLPPSRQKVVTFSAVGDCVGAFKGSVEALNLDEVRSIAMNDRSE